MLILMDSNGGIENRYDSQTIRVPGDISRLRKVTIGNKKNAVVMSAQVYMSIPCQNRPLKDRTNIVMTNKHFKIEPQGNVIKTDSLISVMNIISEKSFDNVYVIGGTHIYDLFYHHCSNIIVTQIETVFNSVSFLETDVRRYTKYAEIGAVITDKHSNYTYRYMNYNMNRIREYINDMD